MKDVTRRVFLKSSGAAALGSAVLGQHILTLALTGCTDRSPMTPPDPALLAELQSSAAKPNILLITADDLGETLGCYGDSVARTPNLNRLATEGIRFANAYVTNASCSSSRSSVFTGLYPHQTGYFAPDRLPFGQIGLAGADSAYEVDGSVRNMLQLLKAAGYRRGRVGKTHVRPFAAFTYNYGVESSRDPVFMTQQAERFWGQQPQQPFFLLMSYVDPHVPFQTQVNGYPRQPYGPAEVPPFPWQGVDTPKVRARMAGYYNGVARLDAAIGMLMQKLAQLGLASNTMVIFMGDHGPPCTRAKVSCYEAGLRIPFLVRWPGHIAPNRVNTSFVSTLDIMPTVLQAAGIPVPQNLEGRSLMQLFQGNTAGWRSTVCAEYTSHTRGNFYPRRSIRNGRYKYILNLLSERANPILSGDGDVAFSESRTLPAGHPARVAMDICRRPPKEELYDLATDPIEFHNLAARSEYQTQLNALRSELRTWRQATADPLLDPAVLTKLTQYHYGDAASAATRLHQHA